MLVLDTEDRVAAILVPLFLQAPEQHRIRHSISLFCFSFWNVTNSLIGLNSLHSNAATPMWSPLHPSPGASGGLLQVREHYSSREKPLLPAGSALLQYITCTSLYVNR